MELFMSLARYLGAGGVGGGVGVGIVAGRVLITFLGNGCGFPSIARNSWGLTPADPNGGFIVTSYLYIRFAGRQIFHGIRRVAADMAGNEGLALRFAGAAAAQHRGVQGGRTPAQTKEIAE